jgi:hypothetical protein
MLTASQFDKISTPIADLYEQYNQSVINDIARRLVKLPMTATAAWQMQRLTESGMVYEKALEELAKVTGQSETVLRELFNQAGVKSQSFDDSIYEAAGLNPLSINLSPAMQNVLLAGLRKTDGSIKNLTMTTAIDAQHKFADAADLAYMQVTNGAMSYDEAIRAGIKDLAAQGLSTIDYKNRVDQLDVAMRRSVLTGVAQTTGNLSIERANELRCDLVQTSAHIGARPEHEEWQGQVFSISGSNPDYPPFSDTGYGEVDGLCGINCRHSFYPFFEGISENAYTEETLQEYANETVTYNGNDMSVYKATQEQRAVEREIRKTKRQAGALGSVGLDNTEEISRVRDLQARMRDFIDQTGLSRQSSREGGRVVKVITAAPTPVPVPVEGKVFSMDPSPVNGSGGALERFNVKRALLEAEVWKSDLSSHGEFILQRKNMSTAIGRYDENLVVYRDPEGVLKGALSYKDPREGLLQLTNMGALDENARIKMVDELKAIAEKAHSRIDVVVDVVKDKPSVEFWTKMGFKPRQEGSFFLEWKPAPLPVPAAPTNLNSQVLAGSAKKTVAAETNMETLMEYYKRSQGASGHSASEIKNIIVQTISDRSGVDYDSVNDFIHQWAMTSNDNDYRSLYIQKIVAEKYGIPLSEWQSKELLKLEARRALEFDSTLGKAASPSINSLFENKTINGIPMFDENITTKSMHEKILDVMYANTQEYLKANGITGDVWVFRGIGMDEAIMVDSSVITHVTGSGITTSLIEAPAGVSVSIETNALSSWSLSQSTAYGFDDGKYKYVLGMKIPVERIMSLSLTGNGCLTEWELTVLGNALDQVSILSAK